MTVVQMSDHESRRKRQPPEKDSAFDIRFFIRRDKNRPDLRKQNPARPQLPLTVAIENSIAELAKRASMMEAGLNVLAGAIEDVSREGEATSRLVSKLLRVTIELEKQVSGRDKKE